MAEIYDTPGPMPIKELTMERSPEEAEARRIDREAKRERAEAIAWRMFEEASERSRQQMEKNLFGDAYDDSRLSIGWFEKWESLSNQGDAYDEMTEAGLDY
jgi:hypothetical protein